jgi:3-hydroxy-3-methylglutaryl CoA synthase
MRKLLRVRFKANFDDYRPINWPVKYPYWCSGYGEDFSIVITYADSVDYVMENWPEASDLQIDDVDKITFSDRFPKPDWYKEDGE